MFMLSFTASAFDYSSSGTGGLQENVGLSRSKYRQSREEVLVRFKAGLGSRTISQSSD